MNLIKTSKSFFRRDGRIVAKELLGKLLVRNYNGCFLVGKIVETEAYIGKIDKACHAYGDKKTPKVMPLYSNSGISYIYSIYGMYHCFNIITGEEGDPQGVLIRAVEPLIGMDIMSMNRFKKSYDTLKKKEILNLTSGPSKLCIAFNIDKTLNTHSIFNDELYVCNGEKDDFDIICCERIGIDYAEEAVHFPWRYYIDDNPFVSITKR